MPLFSTLCISQVSGLSIKHHSPAILQTSRLFQSIHKPYVPIMYIIMARRPGNRGSIAGRGRKSLLESVQIRYGAHSVSVRRMRKPHFLGVKRPEREADDSTLLLPMLRMSAAMTPHLLHFYGVHRDSFTFSCILILYYFRDTTFQPSCRRPLPVGCLPPFALLWQLFTELTFIYFFNVFETRSPVAGF